MYRNVKNKKNWKYQLNVTSRVVGDGKNGKSLLKIKPVFVRTGTVVKVFQA